MNSNVRGMGVVEDVKKNIVPFSPIYKQLVLSIDMKTKVGQHVLRSKLDNLTT